MSSSEILILIAAFALIMIAITYSQVKDGKRRILDYLTALGVRDIKISWDWAGGDRGNHAFNVEYTDHAGKRHQTNCKITSSLFGDSGIYWLDPPQV